MSTPNKTIRNGYFIQPCIMQDWEDEKSPRSRKLIAHYQQCPHSANNFQYHKDISLTFKNTPFKELPLSLVRIRTINYFSSHHLHVTGSQLSLNQLSTLNVIM